MYLSHLKEEVDKIAENPKIIIILVFLFILIAGAGGWLLCRHYDNLERADRDNVRATVRNAQELNRDAQTELDRAREANQDAADANQNAQRAADDLADSTAKLSDLNRSDADAIDAAERVFSDVERANQ
ncbi:MAG: Tar ligand binding domain-containing protein [Megasphaera elsdenii]|nr:Tar ligand binding domain-containing protein [Megasphaera elsdenii]